MKAVPESHRNLLSDPARALAYLATTMPDGSPQVTPVWFDVDGEELRINTARGRTKERNLSARPRLALAIADPADPYRYIQIRGTVREMTEAGAVDHIRRLSRKYRGTEDFALSPGEVRVTIRIRADRVSVHG